MQQMRAQSWDQPRPGWVSLDYHGVTSRCLRLPPASRGSLETSPEMRSCSGLQQVF